MPFLHFNRITVSERHNDFLAAGVIVLYCVAYSVNRLLISPSMELSEAEQFLDAQAFSFGYNQQAPLYSWIAGLISLLFGMNIVTLTAVKYSLLFLLYFFFFLIVRDFWDSKKSLLITGSLLLFPTYSYELHRDLTHTILVSLMAVITCYIYIRAVREAKTLYYLLAGISIGLGILSKYNFIFFLAALLLSSLSCREGRRVVFDRRIFLSILLVILVVLPHLVWLAQENFLSVDYALARSRAGESATNSLFNIFSVVGFSYLEVLLFFLFFGFFFHRYFSMNGNKDNQLLRLFRLLVFYGLMVPLSVAFFLQSCNFSSRWLAPVLFTLPLAMFSLISMDTGKVEFRFFRYLCLFVAIAVLAVRTFVGFFPDVAGKVERIHVPYRVLSQQLIDKLKERGIDDFRNLAVIADADGRDRCIAANIMASMPATKFVPMRNVMTDSSIREDIMERGGIFAFDPSRSGIAPAKRFIAAFPSALRIVTLEAPYLHSIKSPPHVLGVVIIPKKERTI